MTHVPLESQVDDGLNMASKEVWQNRALLWGDDCLYKPDKNTAEFLQMVYSNDSPVVAVLAGHLYFPYTSKLTNGITQYALDASYKGGITVFLVSGKEK